MNFDLRDLDRLIVREAEAAIWQGGEDIARNAKHLAPRKSGELRDSIKVEHSANQAVIFTSCDHAAVEEFGNHDQVAHPYLRPAFDNLARSIEVHVISAIDHATTT